MRAALLVLLWPALCWADPPRLKIPAEIKPSGQYVEMLPDTDAVSVAYVGLDRLDPIPARWLAEKRVFLLDTRGLASGRYRFAAVGAGKEGEQTRVDFVVVIGDVPPGPDPGPGPTPPPDDPLTKTLQAAYDKETATDKAVLKGKLVSLYRQAAELALQKTLLVPDSDTGRERDVAPQTWGQLMTAIRTAAVTLGVSGKLPLLQQAVKEGALSDFPTEAQRPLDDDGRKKAAAAFVRAAAALEGVK